MLTITGTNFSPYSYLTQMSNTIRSDESSSSSMLLFKNLDSYNLSWGPIFIKNSGVESNAMQIYLQPVLTSVKLDRTGFDATGLYLGITSSNNTQVDFTLKINSVTVSAQQVVETTKSLKFTPPSPLSAIYNQSTLNVLVELTINFPNNPMSASCQSLINIPTINTATYPSVQPPTGPAMITINGDNFNTTRNATIGSNTYSTNNIEVSSNTVIVMVATPVESISTLSLRFSDGHCLWQLDSSFIQFGNYKPPCQSIDNNIKQCNLSQCTGCLSCNLFTYSNSMTYFSQPYYYTSQTLSSVAFKGNLVTVVVDLHCSQTIYSDLLSLISISVDMVDCQNIVMVKDNEFTCTPQRSAGPVLVTLLGQSSNIIQLEHNPNIASLSQTVQLSTIVIIIIINILL
ncbi:hypothetical protein SAMD00019534_074790 [Acytostelium subglobosum LB1]|uniref:hypothetical protein n=1 Tax=Acytostelium subglobosum LB1 TaxID=1410327 RepID=UPI000644C120|nr:hypothetical protein SAMD00019534_074790 [Acytostelium subglobosum LB1]GAM24304.1 hypothetical protein SAMD00019534_074790 [Acytostelium subglobosum LB1]|eukprot:XP_012752630.1 hypothetical protein SAMD00019534_074790 [Acytostelium subglobosum LB1]